MARGICGGKTVGGLSRLSFAILLASSLAAGACSCGKDRAGLVQAAPEPTTLQLSEDALFFDALGESAEIGYEVLSQVGEAMDVAVGWHSNDPDVAEVEGGRVTSRGNGVALIEARIQDLRATVRVTVQQIPAFATVEPERLVLTHLGERAAFTPVAKDRNGYAIEGASFRWTSQNTEVATVDAGGRATARANGVAEVIATTEEGEVSASGQVEVRQSAHSLRVIGPEAPVPAGRPIAALVEAVDAGGARVADLDAEIVLSLGENPPSATLGGTLRPRLEGGVASVEDLRIEKAARGYTLAAALGGEIGGESDPFDVVGASPASLTFLRSPEDTYAGGPVRPVQLGLLDAYGNPASSGEGEVHLKLLGFEEGLQGTRTLSADAAVVDFEDLTVSVMGPEHVLEAVWSGAPDAPAQSLPFAVHAGLPAALVWVVHPQDADATENIGPVELVVYDEFGNRTSEPRIDVTIELVDEEGEATLEGEREARSADGQVRFEQLSVDKVGTYRLVASAAGMAPVESQEFTVSAGAPAQLRFIRSPASAVRGELLPLTEVAVLDAGGNPTDATPWVDMSLLGGPGTLIGGTSVRASGGVASFPSLRIDREGTGYRLRATSGELDATSTPFDVSACETGLTDCDGSCTDVGSDPFHCGACGVACGPGQTCGAGRCECNDPSLEVCGDRCVNWEEDPLNCGGCGVTCRADQVCDGGRCVCADGDLLCGGVCINPDEDDLHCGGCNRPCGEGSRCGGGTCIGCAVHEEICGEVCADLSRDPLNCGACGNACAVDDVCSSGRCMPDPEYANWPVPPDNPTNYTATAETVLDNVTKLMWQRNVTNQTYTQAEARSYCENLQLAGFRDWRLPTRIELISIVSETRDHPAINTSAFPNTPYRPFREGQFDPGFWSTSMFGGNPSQGWQVNFSYGFGEEGIPVSYQGYVRCVRYDASHPAAADLPARYTVGGDTVTDNRTLITWQRAPSIGQSGDYYGASNWCSMWFGWSGLPRRKELETLVDVRRRAPAWNSIFGGYRPEWYWTRTPNRYGGGYYWTVHSEDGWNGATEWSLIFPVARCVK